MEFTIEYDVPDNPEDGLYRLCCDDLEGPLVGLGDVATVVGEDGEIYYTQIENPEEDEPAVFRLERGVQVATADLESVETWDQPKESPGEGVVEMPS